MSSCWEKQVTIILPLPPKISAGYGSGQVSCAYINSTYKLNIWMDMIVEIQFTQLLT